MAYNVKDTKKWLAQWFETKREALEYKRQKKLSSSLSMDMKLSNLWNELKGQKWKIEKYLEQ